MRIPKEFKLIKKQCKATTNEKGLLSELPPITKTIGIVHYPLLCVLNDCKPMSHYINNSYQFCYNKLLNNCKIQIMASVDNIQTIIFYKDKQDNMEMICYKDSKYEEQAYLCVYLNKLLRDATDTTRLKLLSFNNSYNHLMGKLYGYSEGEIRGYYLQKYLLKSLPKKIKSQMMKHITESNFDLDFVTFKSKMIRLYNALKKVDDFKDFDEKYNQIKHNSDKMGLDTLNSKEFKSFKRSIKPKPFKFEIAELTTTFPNEYSKLAPKLTKFKKSISKKSK